MTDYLGDLDAWLRELSPGRVVDLIGHGLGANVAMLYAGLRPQRVRCVVNLEGFGLPEQGIESMPARLLAWLDALRTAPAPEPEDSLDEAVMRLHRQGSVLGPDAARWLAMQWNAPREGERWSSRCDPLHRRPHPLVLRRGEILSCWQRIKAPVLFVEGAGQPLEAQWGGYYPRADLLGALALVPQLEQLQLPLSGHLLHQARPQALAQAIEDFLADPRAQARIAA